MNPEPTPPAGRAVGAAQNSVENTEEFVSRLGHFYFII